jgi:HPt (histidine-containing phosphotransfer) domain-containing protein
MTAAAMSHDREASAAAGMNDHVSKPIDPRELADSLVRWVKPTAAGERESPPAEAPASDAAAATRIEELEEREEMERLERALPGVSIDAGLARVGGNSELYRRLLQTFADRHRDTVATLRALQQAGDLEQLYMEAHNMKGEAGNLGFDSLKSSADLLSQQIKSGDQARLPELTEILVRQCQTTLDALETLRKPALSAGQAAAPGPADGAQPIDHDQLPPLLEQLAAQLKSRNLGARRLAGEIDERVRGSELAAEFSVIAQAAQQLRYDAALLALQQLLDRHQWRQP